MKFYAVLNRDGGTLRTADLDALSAMMTDKFAKAGHQLDINIVTGGEIVTALDAGARKRGIDAVLAGGGDGTISAAASRLMNSKKALAVLPAGTMNLFARSLGIPLGLEAAIAAIADGETKPVDMALANGRPFIHQFSIGMHAKMVHLREKMDFGSRVGKIGASMRAAYYTIKNPPNIRVALKVGEADLDVKTTGIGVTNNLFGEGHLPYADHPDGGVLGIYVTLASQRNEIVRFALNAARGRWHTNPHVDVYQATEMSLRIVSRSTRFKCVIDGELAKLDRETHIEIKPQSLLTLVPKPSV